MDIFLVVARLIHIAAAILWVGSGFYNVVILLPGLAAMGADGGKVLVALAKNRAFTLLFPISAGVTVLAGLLLYFRPGEGDLFTSTGRIVLSIGAVAGLLAAGHGGAVLGRQTGEYVAKVESGAGQTAEIQAMGEKLLLHGKISLVLMIIAVIGMGSARYL